MAETGGVKTSFEGVCNERLCSPYETPDVPKLVNGEFPESAGEVVRDADVVGIKHEIVQGDMDGKVGRREEQTEEKSMGHDGSRCDTAAAVTASVPLPPESARLLAT
jgi:hypothetical protein